MIGRASRAWWAVPAVVLWILGTGLMAYAAATSASLSWSVLLVNSPALIIVGLLIGLRRPGVLVGQFLAISGGGFAVAALLIEDVAEQLDVLLAPGLSFAVLLTASVSASLAIGSFAAALLLFPDGRLPSRSWRWLAWLLAAFATIGTVWSSVFAISNADRALMADTLSRHELLLSTGVLVGSALMLATLSSLAVRARQSSGVVQRQVGLVAYGVGIYVAFLVAAMGTGNSLGGALADQLFFSAIPLAIWIAIARHGLYDLGRLVSRTVVYAIVVGSLAAVYLGTFTVFSTWLPIDTDLGVAASTLAAIAAFNPLRRRIQRAVDRRFFRTRYETREVFSRFSEGLEVRHDSRAIEKDTIALLAETLAPESASMWIRS